MDELKSEKLFQDLHAEIGATGFMGAQARLAGYRAQVIAEKQELLDQRDTLSAGRAVHDDLQRAYDELLSQYNLLNLTAKVSPPAAERTTDPAQVKADLDLAKVAGLQTPSDPRGA